MEFSSVKVISSYQCAIQKCFSHFAPTKTTTVYHINTVWQQQITAIKKSNKKINSNALKIITKDLILLIDI